MEHKAIDYAKRIISRQVPEEKANIHCGAWPQNYKAYNQGGHFPHYLIPLIEMSKIWDDHPDAAKWENTVHEFAYGYFIPATGRIPYLILLPDFKKV